MLTAYLIGSMLAAGMGFRSSCEWANEHPEYKVNAGVRRVIFVSTASILCIIFSWFAVGILLVDELRNSK